MGRPALGTQVVAEAAALPDRPGREREADDRPHEPERDEVVDRDGGDATRQVGAGALLDVGAGREADGRGERDETGHGQHEAAGRQRPHGQASRLERSRRGATLVIAARR